MVFFNCCIDSNLVADLLACIILANKEAPVLPLVLLSVSFVISGLSYCLISARCFEFTFKVMKYVGLGTGCGFII